MQSDDRAVAVQPDADAVDLVTPVAVTWRSSERVEVQRTGHSSLRASQAISASSA